MELKTAKYINVNGSLMDLCRKQKTIGRRHLAESQTDY